MKIPFFQNRRENLDLKFKHKIMFNKFLKSGIYLQGKEIQEVEKKISKIYKKKFAVAVNSCTDALFFSLIASGIKKNDEVLVTNFSWISSASAIVRAGAIPKFVDINDDFNINLSDAEKKINRRTKAIILVNLFGKLVDSNKLDNFLKKKKLIVISDSAQSFGLIHKNKSLEKKINFTCLSFDPTKVVSAFGSGGMILCNDKLYYKKLLSLRYHGKTNNKFYKLGYNSQLSTIAASSIIVKLKYFKIWEKKRILIAKKYIKCLQKYIEFPKDYSKFHIFHKFVIKYDKRELLNKYLLKKGISTRIHYPKPLSANKMFLSFGPQSKYKNTNSLRFSKKVLSLPIHPYLKKKEIDYICKELEVFFKNKD